jgi:aryl-alcohol dehydrogenase-like predicted oxidoreductase
MPPLSGNRALGPAVTGPAVLGCGSFGGIGSAPSGLGGGLSMPEAFAVMDAAVDQGITIFDTADGYAGGESERMIGEWLRQRDAGVTITTKVGVAWDRPTLRDLSSGRIRSHARESMDRLGLDRIELYMMHAPDPGTPIEESLEAFDDLHQQGLVGGLGLCNVDVRFVEEWQATAERMGAIGFSWIQNELNLLTQGDLVDLLPLCQELGVGYTAYSPLAGGILADRYAAGGEPPEGSRIAVLPEQYGPRLDHDVRVGLAELREMAAERRVAPATLAMAWVMGRPGVTAAIVAPRTPAQLTVVIEAAELALDASDLARLTAMFRHG